MARIPTLGSGDKILEKFIPSRLASRELATRTNAARMSILPAPIAGSRPTWFERFYTDGGRSTRTEHTAVEEMTLIFLTYGNYGNIDQEPNSAIKVRAGLEYPLGTFYKAHFTGEDASRDATIAPGGFLSTQAIAVRIPKGAKYYVNTLVVPVTAGGQYPAGGLSVNPNGNERVTVGTTDYTTATNPGSTTLSYFGYGPVAITAQLTNPVESYALVGDSILAGVGDQVSNSNETGWGARVFNAKGVPYVNVALSGEDGANWGEGSAVEIARHRFRALLAAAADKVLCGHGTNDFGNNNRTVAVVQTNAISRWTQLRRRGGLVYQTTITPRTTSTDAWVTTANQAAVNTRFGPESGNSGAGSDQRIFNQWLRDGAPMLNGVAVATGTNAAGTIRAGSATHPLAGIVDVAPAVEQFEASTNTWVWKPNMTTDGIHPNVAGHTAIAALASAIMFPA